MNIFEYIIHTKINDVNNKCNKMTANVVKKKMFIVPQKKMNKLSVSRKCWIQKGGNCFIASVAKV